MCSPEEIGIKEDDPEKQGSIVIIDASVDLGTPFIEAKGKVISN